MNKKFDFKKLNTFALANIEQVVSYFAPMGKRVGHEWVALNPTRDDRNSRSFSINLNTGMWADFATNDKGGDVISYVAYVKRISQVDAYRTLAHFLGLSDSADANSVLHKPVPSNVKAKPKAPAFIPIFPPQTAIKSCPQSHPVFGKASDYWDYISAYGDLEMRICRFDFIDSNGEQAKEYRPYVYGTSTFKSGKTRTGWHTRQLPNNRPLFGLDQLAKYPDDMPVFLAEGEKASMAQRLLFKGCPCVTWSGGSKAIAKTNFSPLAGRGVWYWHDNDKAGEESVCVIRKTLLEAGVSEFRLIDISLFDRYAPGPKGQILFRPSLWPHKADAFDALQMGWTAKHLRNFALRGELLVPFDLRHRGIAH